MSADIKLIDYKGNIVKPGDKILMAMHHGLLIERIYLGRTDRSFLFTKYAFNKDSNRKVETVTNLYGTYTKKVNKDNNIMEHNTVYYIPISYFEESGIMLLERESKDIAPCMVRRLRGVL